MYLFRIFRMSLAALYQSSSSELEEEIRDTKRIKKVPKKHVVEKTFLTIGDAEKFVENEKNWSYAFVNSTQEGMKRHYRCNKVKKRGIQCEASIYLLFDSMSEEICLYRSETVHIHVQIYHQPQNQSPLQSRTTLKNYLT